MHSVITTGAFKRLQLYSSDCHKVPRNIVDDDKRDHILTDSSACVMAVKIMVPVCISES